MQNSILKLLPQANNVKLRLQKMTFFKKQKNILARKWQDVRNAFKEQEVSQFHSSHRRIISDQRESQYKESK